MFNFDSIKSILTSTESRHGLLLKSYLNSSIFCQGISTNHFGAKLGTNFPNWFGLKPGTFTMSWLMSVHHPFIPVVLRRLVILGDKFWVAFFMIGELNLGSFGRGLVLFSSKMVIISTDWGIFRGKYSKISKSVALKGDT